MGKKCVIMGLCQPAEVVELGRHAVLRGPWAQARVGSSPALGTSAARAVNRPALPPVEPGIYGAT